MYEKKYIQSINKGLLDSHYKVSGVSKSSSEFFNLLIKKTFETKKNNGRMFFFGNGASASFSNHMALDWIKNAKVLSYTLSDSTFLTALANDYSYEESFLEFFKMNVPVKDDIVITTSSSGNSANVVRVLKYCRENNITTLALSGLDKNNLSNQLSEFSLYVPMKTYGMVESIHQIFHHMWFDKFLGVEEWNRDGLQNMNSKDFKL
ncbi:MAG: hypothetical protein CMC04_09745 [Flavobacteriaceae bacterium]|nr:hypothetical protein [Flavobacteriaceae bacterium]